MVSLDYLDSGTIARMLWKRMKRATA